jgi:MoaA/NifB/PqqE/SkfB family radical SAM enzyme
MRLSDFRRALDMLEEISDFPEVYLVGGEPSTVPNILEFLDAVAEKKWGATLYTNGAFGDRLRDAFAEHPGLQRVALHFEQSFFDSYDNFEKRWMENIRVLSRTKECSLLFVAMGADFDYARPLDLAEEFGLKLTWVFAAPSSGGTPFVGLPTMRAAGLVWSSFCWRRRRAE